MTNEQAILEIDKGIILLQGIRAGLQAQAAPVIDPTPSPAPAPAPTPAPVPTTTLTATLMGRAGDNTAGNVLGTDGKIDVQIRVTGCPADVTRVVIRDNTGAGAVWNWPAAGTYIIAVKPQGGGVVDLFFTHWRDYPSYRVELTFRDGTAADLIAKATTVAGPAPAPAPSPEPTPPTFPSVIIPGSRTGAIPYTDQYCSAIMDGAVLCNIVLLESDSTTRTGTAWDEDWSEPEKIDIYDQAKKAAMWWKFAFQKAVPGAKHPLSFGLNIDHLEVPVTVSYEPITTRFADRALWMRQAMAALGYPGSDYLANCRKFNHASRLAAGADWAFTMFVIDSQNDSDGKFADGFACWAHFGGPCCYLTSDAGAWGTDRFWRNAVHEWAHCFGPRDAYAGSGSKYTDTMGYLFRVQNTNAIDGRPAGAPPQQPDIMAGASMQDASLAAYQVCRETAWALGWIDTDGDGILDARGK